ncbi:hypothetical protein EXIGLDRAFT_55875 [Exidia glandulosa HHB12029]|uniref:Uncharacterized protein n=1 Tax=Exidia glandulosa HHB12029 TaxID=1314781 RepID=A0A165I951_EXIGL|nr:hypothetical protein EXIGLDRAFT_55875 [Exidia glandulosa HHB12029]
MFIWVRLFHLPFPASTGAHDAQFGLQLFSYRPHLSTPTENDELGRSIWVDLAENGLPVTAGTRLFQDLLQSLGRGGDGRGNGDLREGDQKDQVCVGEYSE